MEVLYPKDYVATEKTVEEVVKDTTVLKTFIKNLVKTEAKPVEEIIKLVDEEYVKTNSEDIHFLAQDIEAVCKEIDEEFRPVEVKVEVDENTLPEAGL